MSKVAYTIKKAAKATSLDEEFITEAVRDGNLIARVVTAGSLAVVLISRIDLHAWVQALSRYKI